MSSLKQKRLLLLDGNAIIHRAFHAIPPLQTQTGLQVNTVYGFTATFLNVLEKFQPDYIICAFDMAKKTFRNEKFSEYKANRKSTAEDLVPQFALTKNLVKSLNIVVLEKEGFEADDIIGTLAVLGSEKNLETIIVTGDKDTFQLVNDKVKVFTMSRGIKDMVLYDEEMVKEKTGLLPEQMIDYKGLRGDSSDNIPGVKGIGEKTALDLLQKFGSLEKVYESLEEIKESIRQKLIENKEMAYLSQELGTIVTNVPLDFDWEKAKSEKISFSGAKKIFQEFEFKSLLKRLPQNAKEEAQLKKVERENQAKIIVLDQNNFNNFQEIFQKNEVVFLPDFENEIFYGLGLAVKEQVFYLPFNENNRLIFQQFLNDEKIEKVGFDVKKFWHILNRNNLKWEISSFKNDVLLEVYVCWAGKKIELDDLIFEITGRVVKSVKENNQMMMFLRDEKKAQWEICQKTQDLQTIHQFFQREIVSIAKQQDEKNNIQSVLNKIETPLLPILFQMEKTGITLDIQILEKISQEIQTQITKLENDIYNLADEKFNINSTQQLRIVLFDKLQIDSSEISKNKTGFSTASSELEKIREKHSIIAKIEEYRELFKLKTTYIDILPKLADKKNKIHTTFNQAITTTGRLSSSEPNLQNIPIRTENGRQLRKAFVAEKNYKFLSLDYSQIDLRCVAHVSQDENLIEAFQKKLDIHSFTAAQVRSKKIEEVTKEERNSAKELNFGLIYGMGTFGFSRSAGISTTEAKEFIKNYFEKFPKVKEYMENTKKEVLEKGFVETILGRRRNVPEIYSKNFQLKATGERMAINMPIQGLTADLMKLAMIAVNDFLVENYSTEEVRMILQIHDEIILEVKENLAEKLSSELKKIMENVFSLSVPLVVDVAMGNNWNEL